MFEEFLLLFISALENEQGPLKTPWVESQNEAKRATLSNKNCEEKKIGLLVKGSTFQFS